MQTNEQPIVLLKWTGENDTFARLESGGNKVLFKQGDVRDCQYARAKSISSSYKEFVMMRADELTEEEQKGLDKWRKNKEKDAEKLAKAQEADLERIAKRKAKQVELQEEIQVMAAELELNEVSLWANKSVDDLKVVKKQLQAKLDDKRILEEEAKAAVEAETKVEEEVEAEEEVVVEEEVEAEVKEEEEVVVEEEAKK